MAHRFEEGLEVAPHQTNQPGLEHYSPRNEEKMPLSPNGANPPTPPAKGFYNEMPNGRGPPAPAYYDNGSTGYSDNKGTTTTAFASAPSTPPKRRILGLRRRTFFAIIAAILLIIIAAVVGGVVGGMKSSNKNSTPTSTPAAAAAASGAAQRASSSAAASSTASATRTEPLITTTTLLTMPSATFLSDCPSANGTLFKVTNGGNTYNYRILCGAAIFNVNNPKASVSNQQNSLNDCVKQCALNVPGGETCNAVCWRQSRNPDDGAEIGSCFGYETRNTTQDTFNGSLRNSYCDGAVLVGVGDDWGDDF